MNIFGMVRGDFVSAAAKIFFMGMKRYLTGDRWHYVPDWNTSHYFAGKWGFFYRWGPSGDHAYITYEETIVWVMRGVAKTPIETDMLGFLRASASISYQLEIFHGCRGQSLTPGRGLMYTNEWQGDFENFRGVETVQYNPSWENPESDAQWEIRGEREYSGFMLF
jgi:hypothetical protein